MRKYFADTTLVITETILVITDSPDIYGHEPANFQMPTKLCTDLSKGMNKLFSVGDIFYRGENQGGERPSDRGKILIIRQL